MAASKKKIWIFLLALALNSIVLERSFAQSVSDEAEETPSFNFYSESKKDANFIGESDALDTSELFGKMMFAVLLVFALGIIAFYASKKFLPKISNLTGKEIRIVETVHLGSHKMLHLIQVGNQRLLISSTKENVTKLAELSEQ